MRNTMITPTAAIKTTGIFFLLLLGFIESSNLYIQQKEIENAHIIRSLNNSKPAEFFSQM